jgi:hypothetical protein
MSESNHQNARRRPASKSLTSRIVILFLAFLMLSYARASTQNPVFNINIDQDKLLQGQYPLSFVLQAGGQFWTTPFTQYDPATQLGDGYGEGPNGPRSAQRKVFNPQAFNTGVPGKNYPFLRVNGLDSQSCYECHNTIGSDPGYGPGSPLIRKQPISVGGSAGSNSNAFINPCFPISSVNVNLKTNPITLLVRQPPHVFGVGYIQTIADEITGALYTLRTQARTAAQNQPGVAQTVKLLDTAQNLNFGVFKTTYIKGSKWKAVNNQNTCPNTMCGKSVPPSPPPTPETDIGGVVVDGFTDDVGGVTGVAFDLIVRPLQWKGIASSVRHFVRDALDFHFSMQAVEKVGSCDCDMDGKTNEVTIGNVSAIVSFVGMTRPPQQMVPDGVPIASIKRGYEIFTGTSSDPALKLSGQMCATCHVPTLPITSPNPQFVVDNAVGNQLNNCPGDCPIEATGGYTSLVSPLRSYAQVPVLKRIKSALALTATATPIPTTYNIPLNSTNLPGYALPRLSQTVPSFLPFLPQPPAGALYVPLFSDLSTHNMGKYLMDLAPQGADVSGVCIPIQYFLTRPLWGVADTGPWLHDGRATSLMEAILMHGDTASKSGSDAAKIIDAFEQLSPADQQAVVNLLLSFRLPLEQGAAMGPR